MYAFDDDGSGFVPHTSAWDAELNSCVVRVYDESCGPKTGREDVKEANLNGQSFRELDVSAVPVRSPIRSKAIRGTATVSQSHRMPMPQSEDASAINVEFDVPGSILGNGSPNLFAIEPFPPPSHILVQGGTPMSLRAGVRVAPDANVDKADEPCEM
ncbi:unnamed protein product [Tilletia laevis]|uniref:Uncharacterized protein n=1 Tax=Tilletia laevis TaxID=157183 RepID=A0A9N8QLI1_9BASI|nr:unnamed protein product [Tilletia caries]CAD6958692.1 unnamed protein product [Tilletia laevis]